MSIKADARRRLADLLAAEPGLSKSAAARRLKVGRG